MNGNVLSWNRPWAVPLIPVFPVIQTSVPFFVQSSSPSSFKNYSSRLYTPTHFRANTLHLYSILISACDSSPLQNQIFIFNVDPAFGLLCEAVCAADVSDKHRTPSSRMTAKIRICINNDSPWKFKIIWIFIIHYTFAGKQCFMSQAFIVRYLTHTPISSSSKPRILPVFIAHSLQKPNWKSWTNFLSQTVVFWALTLCSLVRSYQRFGGTYASIFRR